MLIAGDVYLNENRALVNVPLYHMLLNVSIRSDIRNSHLLIGPRAGLAATDAANSRDKIPPSTMAFESLIAIVFMRIAFIVAVLASGRSGSVGRHSVCNCPGPQAWI
jgi:hypothetical protein